MFHIQVDHIFCSSLLVDVYDIRLAMGKTKEEMIVKEFNSLSTSSWMPVRMIIAKDIMIELLKNPSLIEDEDGNELSIRGAIIHSYKIADDFIKVQAKHNADLIINEQTKILNNAQ